MLPPTPENLEFAAGLLRTNEVVACPTETVYGLAVDPFSEVALGRLFAAKGRDDGNPVLLVVDNAAQLSVLAREVSDAARACMDAFWPGPLSLLFPAIAGLPERIVANGKVCVRCPACDTARALCRAFGAPLTSTSANRTGELPAVSALAIDLEGVALVLDGGALPPAMPSTVFDPDARAVLRSGALSLDVLEGVAGPVLRMG
jgi:L-threonylcarbamoyladenylate synthase